MDACAYKYCEEINGEKAVSGLILVHVDDMLILSMGKGKEFKKKIAQLREVFKFGSWNKNAGMFLGMMLLRRKDGSIAYGNSEFAEQLKPIAVNKGARLDELANERQIGQMRAALGSLQ